LSRNTQRAKEEEEEEQKQESMKNITKIEFSILPPE